MKLEEIFSHVPILERLHWDGSRTVLQITKDSRQVGQGALFAACRGPKQNGHDFIAQAVSQGAVAVIYDEPAVLLPHAVAGIRVKDVALAFPEILKAWHGFRDESVAMIGVTGTNGKTTITRLFYELLGGRKHAGTIGTLSYELPSGTRESANTTPGPETLIPLLAEMASQGARYVSMEVSSHALEQKRVSGLRFDLAVFTQLTQDHLDYHHDMESYFQAKRKLFSDYQPKHMLINRDCPYGRRLLEEFPQAKSFSVEGSADYQALDIQESLNGCRFNLAFRGNQIAFETQLPLHYNISNCTAVLAGLDLLGADIRQVAGKLAEIPFVPGRMERVPHPAVHFFVDYAHTPDAFVQVLKHVRLQKPARIITVFGCGGDRDRTKRPRMARAAADDSDILVLTSDNPRTENPQMILNEIKAGLNEKDFRRISIVEDLDRRRAIHQAVGLARPGDAVLILGKGHEDYQIIGTEKHHFSDRETILEALSSFGSGLCPTATPDFSAPLNFYPHSVAKLSAIMPFSIDTRTLQPGDFFVALDGTKQKGVTFLTEAFRRGASGALCARRDENEVPAQWKGKVSFVEDPAVEMARLAREHRRSFQIPVVGVVGSVGKTSTKQFLSYLLSRRRKVLATTGNLNNHLGLPLMLSRLKSEHQAAVLEMGADHVGDLSTLVCMAEPDLAVLTPIAPEHLLGFGSLAGVYDGELEILESPNLKTLVTVEGDAELDRRLAAWKGKILRVGFAKSADFVISNLNVQEERTFFKINGHEVILPTPAAFLALNAGLAAAMAMELGLTWEDMAGAWEPELPKGRFAMRKMARGLTVIDDTYNSSPKAFAAALSSLGALRFSRKQLIFSDMLELGLESEKYHRQLADEIDRSDLNQAWAFGTESRVVIEALKAKQSRVDARWFESAEALAAALVTEAVSGDLILFKGSRGMKVERVLEILEKSCAEKVF